MVRYEDHQGVAIFRAATAVEFFYPSVAEHLIRIGHVLESSRKFRARIVFLENNTTRQG